MIPRPKTILHVLAAPGVGLAARQLALLASDPDPTFVHKVAILHRDPALAAYLAAEQLHVFPREQAATSALLPFAFVAGRWLSELATRAHADLVQAHDERAAAAAAPVAHRRGIPFVRTETSADGVDHFLQRFELKRTRLFVASSEHVRQRLLRRIPLLAPKMVLAPTALPSPRRIVPLRPTRPGARLRLHLVGVPPRQDGVVMQALREVADLVISHDFSEPAAHSEMRDDDPLRHVDAVVAAGPVPLGHDAEEPVELAVLRAMSHGRPAVVVPGGVFVELVAESEAGAACGLIARDDSVAALVEAAQRLASQPLDELGARARAAFERDHTAEQLRKRYRSFYESVLSG